MPFKYDDVTLDVRGISTKLRYLEQPGESPSDPVILLLHGHSSSTEEFVDLLPELEGKAHVFAFDQPNCGLSAEVKRDTVRAKYESSAAFKSYEGLFYLRDVSAAFATAVVVPRVGTRKVRVAGGSLGGNLTLLLAERTPRYSWIERAFVWSPGSAWPPSASQSLGAGVARKRSNHDWSAPGQLREFLELTFTENTVPLPEPKSYPQPWYWYWDCWGQPQGAGQCQKVGRGGCALCKRAPKLEYQGQPLAPTNPYPGMGEKKVKAIEGALHAVASRLTPVRAQWHWEIAAEQVELSHWQPVTSGMRIGMLQCDTRFMAGTEDKHFPAPLYDQTRALFDRARTIFAHKPSAPKIDSHWFPQTGHSVHNERPADLAAVLAGSA